MTNNRDIKTSSNGHELKRALIILFTGMAFLVLYRILSSEDLLTAYFPDFADDKDLSNVIYYFFFSALFMMMIPVFLLKTVLKENLTKFGLRAGNVKRGLKLVLLFLPVIVAFFIYPASKMDVFRQVYPLYSGAGSDVLIFSVYALLYAVYYFSYEFFYRGFLLFGLEKWMGVTGTILFQVFISTLMHAGKPYPEIVSCIPAGILFGILAYKTGSFLYVFFMHWFIGVMLDLFIILQR